MCDLLDAPFDCPTQAGMTLPETMKQTVAPTEM